ncbi:MAG: aminoacyl--tRNA ligase-related protein [Candidatus Paceibacterota bacterium]|jgi:prolyl-tRNA synthetase
MRQSKLLSKTRKEGPKDEVSKNANLLIRAGFINKEMAGVYDYLPLGLKVLNNICNIIRDELNAIGGQELLLSALQDKGSWEKTGRWSDEVMGIWFKTKLNNGTELGLGATHEEPLTTLLKNHIRSYKDLPVYPYQIQTKFRNEARAKSGIMRGREFLMKDMYSFSIDEKEHEIFYGKVKEAYEKIFSRLGIGDITYFTYAKGGTFSKYSHEFQTLTPNGEDTIYCCDKCKVAVNKELSDELKACPECGNKKLVEKKSSEVGNIFKLGFKFSEPLGLDYVNEEGDKKPVFMGCYGFGPSRTMGTIVEIMSDDKGIVWPVSIAPFKVHLIELVSENKKVKETAEALYETLAKIGIEVLYDDRDARAGEKFNDSDLIGIPLRIVVSEKGIEKGEFEIKERKSGKVSILKEKDVFKFIENYK